MIHTVSIDLDSHPILDDPGRWDWGAYRPARKYGVVHFHPGFLEAYVWSLQLTQEDVYGGFMQEHLKGIPGLLPVSARHFFHRDPKLIPAKLRPYDLFYWPTPLVELYRKEAFIPGSHWDAKTDRWVEVDLPLESDGWGSNERALVLHSFF